MTGADLSRLSAQFNGTARQRGTAYFDEGRVRLTRVSPGSIEASVRGSRMYLANLRRRGTGAAWEMLCTCPAFFESGPCKHLYAVLLAVQHGSEQRRHPETMRDDPDVGGLLDDIELRLFGASSDRKAGHGPHDGADVIAGSRRALWRRQLDELRSATSEVRPGPREDLRLRYVLTVGGKLGADRAEVHATVQRRHKRGTWSEPKPFALDRPGDDADHDDRDRRALALLRAARDPGADMLWLGAGVEIPHPLQPLAFAELARTGRLHLAGESGIATEPLARDEGGIWRLAVGLARDQGGRQLALEGFLERGEERLPLAEPLLVLSGGVFVARGRVSDVDWAGAWGCVPALRRLGPVRAPVSQQADIVELLCTLPGAPRIDAPDFARTVGGPPQPLLHVAAPEEEDGLDASFAANVEFAYGAVRVALLSEANLRREGGLLVRVERDRESESAALARFEAAGGRLDAAPRPGRIGVVRARDLPGLVEQLDAQGWRIEADGKPYRSSGAVSLSVQSGIDWFDLAGHVQFGDARAELPELLRAARSGRRIVRLSDGSHGVLPEDWLAGWGLALAAGTERGRTLRFTKSRAWLLDALLAEREVDVDAAFAEARARLRGFERVEPAGEPEGFRGTLRPYQRDGLGWLAFLREVGFGGCLADDMGLGKTVQVLALLVQRAAAKSGPALVVAPKSVVFNWLREAEHFAPGLTVLEHTGSERRRDARAIAKHDLVVTTYGTLRRDAELLAKIRFDYAILDESQAIKNSLSQSAKAARLLQAEHRLALTGTPVENHLGELASLFEFLNPGMLGGSRALRDLLAATDDLDGARRLARALRPFFLRRTKEAVLTDLPAKTEQTIACDLEGAQRRAYDELREHYRRSLLARADAEGIERIGIHVLEALLRLRQAANHPGLIDAARTGESSAKLDALMPMLDEVCESGHKALVFSQFTSFLAILRERLDAAGRTYEYLDGRTRTREEKVRRFQEDPACPLFLISLKAGGFGLNLTAADYVFLLDPWWNPAVERQAIDRAHRIGQTRPVFAYRLVATDTIEDKVLELQQRKRALAQALFDEGQSSLRDITRADLEWLLT